MRTTEQIKHIQEIADHLDFKVGEPNSKGGVVAYDQKVWGMIPSNTFWRTEQKVSEIVSRVDSEEILEGSCNTAFCIAGTSAVLSVDKIQMRKVVNEPFEMLSVIVDGKSENVSDYACEQMGLSSQEAGVLFDSRWLPKEGVSPGEALRMLAEGHRLSEISQRLRNDYLWNLLLEWEEEQETDLR